MMAPPPPIAWDVSGCEFKTPEGLPTNDHCLQRLQMHITAIHSQPGAASKLDKLRRPSISEGITEGDWAWFEDR